MADNLLLRIYDASESLIIHNIKNDKAISIDKTYMSISKENPENIPHKNINKVYKSSGILGIIQIGVYEFLLYIKHSIKIGSIGVNTEIFEIKEIDHILLSYLEEEISKEVESVLEGIVKMCTQGFFYSNNYDLTNSLQSQKNIKLNYNRYDIIKDANPFYLWNYELINRFIDYCVDNSFLINCIYGYVRIHFEKIVNRSFSYIIISRRHNVNAGIISHKRGLDETGNIANFIETEQIVIVDNNIFSFVQVRGTAPVFYPTKKKKEDEYTILSFNKHIQDMFKCYKSIFVINLMSCYKEYERALTEKLEGLIKDNEYNKMKYMYFDYENEVNERNYNNIDKMLESLDNIFNYFKFFSVYFQNENQFVSDQLGTIRSVCYDGLDKSNNLNMRICWKILCNQLKIIGIDKNIFNEESFGSNNINLLEDFIASVNISEKKIHPFVSKFQEIWNEQNMYLSNQYINKENDSIPDYIKQKCIELFLHKTNLNILSINEDSIKKELHNYVDKYTQSQELIIFIGTWNVAGRDLKEDIDLNEWLNPLENERSPDIYCIGLQEIVTLNASNLLISSNSYKVDYWRSNIIANLKKIDNYTMIKCLDLIGVFMIILVKTSIRDKIVNFDSIIIKTGLMGTMGNKGSCLIRFNFYDTSFAFSCGHLAAGSGSNSSRINEVIEVLNKNFPIYKRIQFREHNLFFIFGDLNFRCDVDFATCMKLISNNDLDTLSENDQFKKAKYSNSNLFDLDEGKLNFNPTYKYMMNTNEYDIKSKRVPSWCDRIFFKKSDYIRQIAYNRVELSISDHKPIYSIFKAYAVKELKEEKVKIIKEIKANMVLGTRGSTIFDNGNILNTDDNYCDENKTENNTESDLFEYFK